MPRLLRSPLHVRIGDFADDPDKRRMRREKTLREPPRLDYPHAGQRPNRNGTLEKAHDRAGDRVRRLRHQEGYEPRDDAARQTERDEGDHKIGDGGKALLRRLAIGHAASLHESPQRRKGEVPHDKGDDDADKRSQLPGKATEQPDNGKKCRNGQQNPI